MDAMKFIEECDRMCKTFDECRDGCPAYDGKCLRCNDEWDKKLVAVVEQWSKEHQRKTRQSVFLKQYPNVRLDTNDIIDISPCQVDLEQYQINDCCKFISCGECRREFWSAEVE